MTYPVSPAPGRHQHQSATPAWRSEHGPVDHGHGPTSGASWDPPGGDQGWTPQDSGVAPPRAYAAGYGREEQAAAAAPSPHEPHPFWSEPTPEDLFWIDVRRQIAYSLKSINAKHTHEAFDRLRKRNALGPHGVVLFYTAPDAGQAAGYQLFKVVRLFLAGPESDDLPRVLHDLCRTAEANISRAAAAGRRWDPRGPEGSMVNSGDMDMLREATFVGTAVSSLNTDQGDWYSVAHSVLQQPVNTVRPMSVFDLRGLCFALLSDGTAMRVERNPHRQVGDEGIISNRTLDPRARLWSRNDDLMERGDPAVRAAWQQLGRLHHQLNAYLNPGR